jgi:hypothetical protein
LKRNVEDENGEKFSIQLNILFFFIQKMFNPEALNTLGSILAHIKDDLRKIKYDIYYLTKRTGVSVCGNGNSESGTGDDFIIRILMEFYITMIFFI